MPALNPTTLEEFRTLGGDDDPKFLATVMTQFLEDLLRHTAKIQAALDQADPEALKKATHALKGSAKAIGTDNLATLAFRLETVGREQILEGAQEAFILAKKEIELVGAAAQEEIHSVTR